MGKGDREAIYPVYVKLRILKPNFMIKGCITLIGDPIYTVDSIQEGSVDIILMRLPKKSESHYWSTPVPLEDYVEIDGHRYEYDNFMRIMYLNHIDYLRATVLWDDAHRDGFWKKFLKVLTPVGVIILISPENFVLETLGNGGFPLCKVHTWAKTETGHSVTEKILVCSLFIPCEKNGEKLPDLIRCPINYRNKGSKENQLPEELCKKLYTTYSPLGATVLGINLPEGAGAIAAEETGRNFVGLVPAK